MVSITIVKIYLLCIIFVLGLTAIGAGAIVALFPGAGDFVAGLADTVSEAIEGISVIILGIMKLRERSGGKAAGTSTIVFICAYIIMSFLQVGTNIVGVLPIAGDVAAPLIKLILQIIQFTIAVILAF